ncbi:hypothetical protein [Ancylomarina sp. 16SWW S1-10-2]|uniref:hypothetical protein n=1 Tax=Ancylomarina sp. 16SWW S1-10-2 TaxID=2499681 RepID=UPI0012AD2523|nr:hypothetical protein [Ancylomarina sp. 16SWW S1-10-2]MRT94568.1 hypothetical protein [Ancylomarina sp. 16SWW S1-10-2]
MEHYLNHLIEDLHQITNNINNSDRTEDESINDDESFYKHIEAVENYLHGDQISISEITGILPEQLPPPERLSERQKTQLAAELEDFLEYFHFALDFPQNYPNHLRYQFIKKFWMEKHPDIQFGTTHIEFCNYEKENCPFPGYCTSCDEIDDENEDMGSFKD